MECHCRCHTDEDIRHVMACCCDHGYKYNCPEKDCYKYGRSIV